MKISTSCRMILGIIAIFALTFGPIRPLFAAEPVVTGLGISPSIKTLVAGEKSNFALSATLSDGTTIDATELASWNPNGSGQTGIPGQRGEYTAIVEGSWKLQATYGGFTAKADITITHGVIAALNLLPKSANLTADGILPLRLFAVDAQGNAWDVLENATFSVNDPSATVSSAGFSPHTAGTWTITAAYSGLTATLPVIITPGMLATLSITPGEGLTTNPNDKTVFTVQGQDKYGNPVNPNVEWTTTNPEVATIEKDGKLTAKSSGQTNVIAKANGINSETPIRVEDLQTSGVTPSNEVVAVTKPQTTKTPKVEAETIEKTPADSNSDETLPSATSSDGKCTNIPHPWTIVLLLAQVMILTAYLTWLQKHKLRGWWIFPTLLTAALLVIYQSTFCSGTYTWWPWAVLGLSVIFVSVYYQRTDTPGASPPDKKSL